VLLEKCVVGEMCCWRNVLLEKCVVGEMCCWRNVLLEKCVVGELCCWRNVLEKCVVWRTQLERVSHKRARYRMSHLPSVWQLPGQAATTA